VQTYETLRPYVEEQARTHTPSLTVAQPFMYALTSGTTGRPKYIPVLGATARQYRRDQSLMTYQLYRLCPEAFAGKMLGIVSPAVEGYLDSDTPYGSVSGYLYQHLPKLVRAMMVVPPEVFSIEPHELRYKTILRLALAERNVSYLGGANPSSFLRLLDLLNVSKHELIASVASGNLRELEALPQRLRRLIAQRLAPDPERAAELRSLAQSGELSFANVWPSVRLLSTWTGGSCGIALGALKQRLPVDVMVADLGYIASELRATLPIGLGTDGGLPMLRDHFFEFVPRDSWDSGHPRFLTLRQLSGGEEYYVIVTTSAGLYRYFMNDVVRVCGFLNATPLLEFVQKGKGVTNISGEKLYESQVLQAVKEVEKELGFSSMFFMMLADEMRSAYELFVESADLNQGNIVELASRVDARLCALNIEYASKRASGRLGALAAYLLGPGAGEAHKRFCLNKGQREGQFKTVALQYKRECEFDFAGATTNIPN
jgi:hypothetical protein